MHSLANSLHNHNQMIVISTSSWEAVQGNLHCYERVGSKIHLIGHKIPIVVGQKGMAIGQGIYQTSLKEGPQKKEGDYKSPAGIFGLGTAFGIFPKVATRLPYLQIQADMEAIDDPNSKYYNQIVLSNKVSQKDWNSSEKMMECLPYYNLGIVINYNLNPSIPGNGSCIFMHGWRSHKEGTGGCTAMAESDLAKLLEWLDPNADPVIIQYPGASISDLT